jgi:RNA-directed DNA polymerase
VENEKPGFNFLGFNVRQFSVGKYHSGKNTQGKLLGFKTIITPSKEKVKVHYEKIAAVIDNHKALPQSVLIKHLNPIIRGWSNYYSTAVSKVIYSSLDNLMHHKLRAWTKRRHPKMGMKEIVGKYWQTIDGDNWAFATRKGGNPLRLLSHASTPIVEHVKVKGEASPYDGNLVYWSTRRGKSLELPTRVTELLKKQKGKCPWCNLHFREEDVMEVDHTIHKSKGGKDEYKNLQLLHRHCHDTKTASDGSPGIKSDCNNVEPKPPRRLEMVEGKWAMRCV